MAEARNAISVFDEHKKGVKLLISEDGIDIHFRIPHPRSIRQHILRRYFHVKRVVQHVLYPVSLRLLTSVCILLMAIVHASAPNSYWRQSWISQWIWDIGLILFPGVETLVPHSLWVMILTGSSAIWTLVVLSLVQRLCLYALLHYHAFLYLDRAQDTRLNMQQLKLWLWKCAIQILSYGASTATLTFGFQSVLPTLPLPSLKDTCERYLASIEPLVSATELESIVDQSRVFLATDGPRLQWYLRIKSWWSRNYVSDWWEQYVYLRGRTSLMINSNYYIMDYARYQPTKSRFARGAVVVHNMLRFKQLLDREQLEPLLIQNFIPLCMDQYRRMFSTCRVAHREEDEIQHWDVGSSQHIIVVMGKRYFQLRMFRHGKLVKPCELQAVFEFLATFVCESDTDLDDSWSHSIAALTALKRMDWADIRERYFGQGQNKASLKSIERAMFVVVFDPTSPSSLEARGRALFHGQGDNRWFDKSLQLVVFDNGRCGINAEHSWADAPVVAHLWEYVLNEELKQDLYDSEGQIVDVSKYRTTSKSTPWSSMIQPLTFEDTVSSHERLSVKIEQAKVGAAEAISDLDLSIVSLDQYGKGFMKQRRISPDAFIQMALQYAYFKDSKGEFTQTYEASMTRLYREGRTETVRPVTMASKALILSLDACFHSRKSNSKQRRAECIEKFHQAAKEHQHLYREAMNGNGIDRHLFTLYCVSVGMNIESDFLKQALGRAWKLSTSQQPQQQIAKNYLGTLPSHVDKSAYYSPGGGFGPVVDEGYGVSYMITGEDRIYFHISSKKKCPGTNSTAFAEALMEAFAELHALWED